MQTNTRTGHPRGFGTPLAISVIVVLLAAGLGFVLVQNSGGSDSWNYDDLHQVRRGDFDVTIPSSGELAALEQIEVRNRLESQATVMEIIDEGETVEQGDLLLRLNDEDIRNRIKDAEDAVNNAESSFIAAEANLAIRQSAAASELEQAQLNVELTELALRAWREGNDIAQREQLELALDTAEINYERLRERYENSKRLFEQQFISADELQRERIAMIEAEASLKQARRDIEVYTVYTYEQEKRQKMSDVDQAVAELERVQQRHEAELETARADLRSQRHQLESRQERLADLEEQLEHTVVKAPSGGLVVYASSMDSHRRGSDEPPEVGTTLSRNELVMVIPDTSKMIASVKVNEALSGLVKPGQDARVTSDALPNTSITGEVLNVGVLAESGGWRDPNRRDYTVRILLDQANGVDLRPSMRCRSVIFVDRVEDALYVPVQSVHRQGRSAYVYVPVNGGYESREVDIGRSSELYVEILDGLNEGDYVLMREPRTNELVGQARRERERADEEGDEARVGPPEETPAEPEELDENAAGTAAPAGGTADGETGESQQ